MTDTEKSDVLSGAGSAINESPGATDSSVRARGRANVAIANITEKLGRGASAIILAAAFIAMFCAAWAAGRVATLGDVIRADHDAYQRDAQSARDSYERDSRGLYLAYQNELQHYREDFQKMERQFRMTELKLDDWTVVAHRSGLALPGDYTRGPQGNLDAESFQVPQSNRKGK